MICEYCSGPHDGAYGSGRFCSSKCARGFSTASKRTEINAKVSQALTGVATGGPRRGNNWTADTAKQVSEVWRRKYESAKFEDLAFGSKRRRIIEEQGGACNKCGVSVWFGEQISLEIDHINGDNSDDRRENLEGLCPNCHSITDTWRGRNKARKVDDGTLLLALIETCSVRQALVRVGLSPKGGNYKRVKRLLGES